MSSPKSRMLLLDGDAVCRIANQIRPIFAGECLANVMQAVAMVISEVKEFESVDRNDVPKFLEDLDKN